MDWYPLNPNDYRADTWHLSLAEHGAYRLLIDYYMANEKPLPCNHQALASIVGTSIDNWMNVHEEVLKLFTNENGKLYHNRCDEELEKSFSIRKGGAARAEKYRKTKDSDKSNALVTRYSRVSNGLVTEPQHNTAQHTTEHNNKKEEGLLSFGNDVKDAFDQFNLIAEKIGLPKAQILTKTRAKKLGQRLKSCNGLDGWKFALSQLEKSPHCQGQNDRGWRADLDFVLQEKSFTKLMEGSYENKKSDFKYIFDKIRKEP